MSDGGTITDNRRYHLQLKEANYVHLIKVLNSNHRALQSVKVMVTPNVRETATARGWTLISQRNSLVNCDTGGGVGVGVSNLVFYAQSTNMVISGRYIFYVSSLIQIISLQNSNSKTSLEPHLNTNSQH